MPDALYAHLVEGAAVYGVSLDDATVERFAHFSRLLAAGNAKTNLISAGDLERLVEYHFLDSLKICSVYDFGSAKTLMDFGSGAGFPGIPLALAFPSCRVTLVESRRLRYEFLVHAVRMLKLPNVTVKHINAVHLPASIEGTFSCVVTRAAATLVRFVEIAGRFAAPDGALIAIKGDTVDKEIKAFETSSSARVFNMLSTHATPVAGVRDGTIFIFRGL